MRLVAAVPGRLSSVGDYMGVLSQLQRNDVRFELASSYRQRTHTRTAGARKYEAEETEYLLPEWVIRLRDYFETGPERCYREGDAG